MASSPVRQSGARRPSPRVCIYCGRAPVTRAHVFGSMLRSEFPGERESVMVFSQPVTPTESIQQRYRDGTGHISMNKPLMCQPCNGEWMASLEDAALPLIVKMVRGMRLSLDEGDAAAIAAWAVSSVTIRSYSDDVRPRSPAQAAEFKANGLAAQRAFVAAVAVARDPKLSHPGDSQSQVFHSADLEMSGLVGVYWLKGLALVTALDDHAAWMASRLALAEKAMVTYPATVDVQAWPPVNSVPEGVLRRILGYEDFIAPGALTNTYRGPGRDVVISARHGDHVHREGVVMLPGRARAPELTDFSSPEELAPPRRIEQ